MCTLCVGSQWLVRGRKVPRSLIFHSSWIRVPLQIVNVFLLKLGCLWFGHPNFYISILVLIDSDSSKRGQWRTLLIPRYFWCWSSKIQHVGKKPRRIHIIIWATCCWRWTMTVVFKASSMPKFWGMVWEGILYIIRYSYRTPLICRTWIYLNCFFLSVG